MNNPYQQYLDDEFDEVALLKETHRLLTAGDVEGAKLSAMKVEAVRYVKQSLKKVEYAIDRRGADADSVQA